MNLFPWRRKKKKTLVAAISNSDPSPAYINDAPITSYYMPELYASDDAPHPYVQPSTVIAEAPLDHPMTYTEAASYDSGSSDSGGSFDSGGCDCGGGGGD